MTTSTSRATVFESLKALLAPHAKYLRIVADDDGDYHLDTHHIMKNKKPLFFGAVQIKKNYVSYHLMPIYVNPALLEDMSDALRKRQQGKSCFNFKSIEPELFAELNALTAAGYRFYLQEGYIQGGA